MTLGSRSRGESIRIDVPSFVHSLDGRYGEDSRASSVERDARACVRHLVDSDDARAQAPPSIIRAEFELVSCRELTRADGDVEPPAVGDDIEAFARHEARAAFGLSLVFRG